MFIGKFGRICFEAEGVSGGGAPAAPATSAAPVVTEHPVSAPWGEAQGVWTLGEGDKAAPWWNTITDEVAKKHVEAKAYANPGELALANYNLTRLHTGDPQVLAMPAADATPEQMRSFYEKLGAPKDATGYEIKIPDGVTADPGMVEFGQSAFHAAGLTPQQAQIVSDKWNEYAAKTEGELVTQYQQQNQQELDALTTSWGAELNANKADGQRAMQALGLSAETMGRLEANVGSAAVVELMATLGKKTREGGFVGGTLTYDANNPDSMSKEQAKTRIAELQADNAFVASYTDKTHPQHAEKVSLMQRLFAKA